MASFIDVIRTVFGSRNAALKIVVASCLLSYPLFRVVSVPFAGWGDVWVIISIIMAVLYLGFMFVSASNLINEQNIIVANFINPFKIILYGIGAIIAVGPMVAFMVYSWFCITAKMTANGFPPAAVNTACGAIELILLGVLSVQMMMFAKNGNPLQAYNLVKIRKCFADFTAKSIFLIISLALLFGVVVFPLGYLTQMMFGMGLVFFMVAFFFFTAMLLLATQYYATCFMEHAAFSTQLVHDEETAGDYFDKKLILEDDRTVVKKPVKKKTGKKVVKKKKKLF